MVAVYSIWRRRREAGAKEEKDIRAGRRQPSAALSLGFSVDGWLEEKRAAGPGGYPAKGKGRELDFSYRAEAFLLL